MILWVRRNESIEGKEEIKTGREGIMTNIKKKKKLKICVSLETTSSFIFRR